MNIRLRSLVWEGTDVCRGTFERVLDSGELSGEFIESVFRIHHGLVDSFQGEPDLLWNSRGSAAQVQTVIRTVLGFCAAAQGETTDAPLS